MARTTIDDRARKARIREREFRQAASRLRKLDNITDDQLGVLRKIKAAEVKGKPLKASSIEDWRALREMGAVKEEDGNLVLTSIGAQVAASGEGALPWPTRFRPKRWPRPKTTARGCCRNPTAK